MGASPQDWRNILIITPIVGTMVATVIFFLRLYARYIVVHKLRVEDFLMGIGLVFTYGVAICTVYSAFHGIGNGRSIWILPPEERLRIALTDWILQKFWPPAQVFIKISIIIFLRRLLDCLERFHQLATVMIVLSVMWGTTAVIGNTVQCWPVQYYWIKHISGHCMEGQDTFYIIIGSLSVLGDVLILCLPLPIVWKLHTPIRQKIEITLLFSIGCLVCIFSILRLISLAHLQTDNLTQNSAMSLLWTILELDVAIICGSLMLMKPLFQLWIGNVRKSLGRLSSGTHSTSTEVSMVEDSHILGPTQGVRSPILFVDSQVQRTDELYGSSG